MQGGSNCRDAASTVRRYGTFVIAGPPVVNVALRHDVMDGLQVGGRYT